jgi:hypothetical protein
MAELLSAVRGSISYIDSWGVEHDGPIERAFAAHGRRLVAVSSNAFEP